MLWSLEARITEPTAWHAHEVFELALGLTTGGILATAAGTLSLERGTTVLVPPGLRHRYSMTAGETVHLKLICIPPNDAAEFLSPMLAARFTALRTVDVVRHHETLPLFAIAELIADGLPAAEQPPRLVEWAAVGVMLALHLGDAGAMPQSASGPYDAKMREIVGWLEDRLDQGIALEQVATRFGLSRSLFIREFRRSTSSSYVEYCNRRRLERAATALAVDGRSVAEAAFDAGFTNLSHFHRQFKAVYGLPPAAFRRKIRGEGGIVV